MKNLIIAALAAVQVMEKWTVYCGSQSDMVWGTLVLFYLVMILLRTVDKGTWQIGDSE